MNNLWKIHNFECDCRCAVLVFRLVGGIISGDQKMGSQRVLFAGGTVEEEEKQFDVWMKA